MAAAEGLSGKDGYPVGIVRETDFTIGHRRAYAGVKSGNHLSIIEIWGYSDCLTEFGMKFDKHKVIAVAAHAGVMVDSSLADTSDGRMRGSDLAEATEVLNLSKL